MRTRGDLFMAKPYQQGNSVVMVLERDLREKLQLRPGDLVIMRVHGPYCTIRRAVPEVLVPLTDLHANDLPPTSVPRSNSAARANDKS